MAELKAAQRRERDAAVKEFNSLAEEADVPRICHVMDDDMQSVCLGDLPWREIPIRCVLRAECRKKLCHDSAILGQSCDCV